MFFVKFDCASCQLVCESSCRFYSFFGMCLELTALAIHLNQISVLVTWMNEQVPSKSSNFGIHHPVNSNLTKGAGIKPYGTARRKGEADRKKPPTQITSGHVWKGTQKDISGTSKRNNDDEGTTEQHHGKVVRVAGCVRTVHQYCRDEHHHEIWDKISVNELTPKPQPSPQELELWMMEDRDKRVAKCSGCTGNFCEGSLPSEPPNDLVLVAFGQRRSTNKVGAEETFKERNIYFYVLRSCLEKGCKRNEMISLEAAEIIISRKTKAELESSHEARIWCLLE